MIAHCIDATGEIRTAVFSLPQKEPRTGNDATEGRRSEAAAGADAEGRDDNRGSADGRTHEALREREINDDTLIGMLVLALGSSERRDPDRVSDHYGSRGARQIAAGLVEGDVLSRDSRALRAAAREMLVEVLSCRRNMSWSGPNALVAGAAIDAGAFLPNMATDDFLRCLPKPLLEQRPTLRTSASNRVERTRAPR